MAARSAQSTRPVVGKEVAQRQQDGGQPHAPRRGAPPGRRLAAVLGLASLLLLGACGSGGGSADVRCSAGQCRAVVTGTPIEVSEPPGAGSMALVAGTTTSRPKPTTSSSKKTTTRPTTRSSTRYADGRDEVDFVVRTVGPGWVEIDEDGIQRVPVGGVFAEDDTLVRLESADGRTAVFVWAR
ncbi:hypothetical protein GCM10023201_06790 [Actinomycetospora corticicola]|uniref:Uncharacterized protein n=1 Tax=Actinomycetospora corticicola TaxID=663602 RepID=A0A7Y9J4U9_9PSEU|nr:hypothetical protein [Actinomycetospora corticicola]NYD35482.1 hypothetical protein [Actinomycetospora corticicola]